MLLIKNVFNYVMVYFLNILQIVNTKQLILRRLYSEFKLIVRTALSTKIIGLWAEVKIHIFPFSLIISIY